VTADDVDARVLERRVLERRVLESRVLELLARTLATAPADPALDLVAAGLLDSLALVELMVAVEQEFQITLAPEELEIDRFRTAAALAALVQSHLEAHP
jgi:acyl carrier protein